MELANETSDTSFAEKLLEARVNGQGCVSLASAVLQQDTATCDLAVDTQRCVLKTLLNIARTGDVGTCRKICSLMKPQIIKLSESKSNPNETRATAIKLVAQIQG